jgi:hypothetical protein
MIAAIARQFRHLLDSSLATGGTELEIIRRFVTSTNGIAHSRRFHIESIFIHQKPYAFFEVPPRICGKVKSELGDILFIIKRIRAGVIIDHRFLFLQAKKMNNGVGLVDVHQFLFYRDISSIDFRFGNSVYAASNVTPLVWSSITKSAWFGIYLFLETPQSLCARTSLIDTQYPGGCTAFPFNLPCQWPMSSACTGYFSFELFLLSFFQFKGIGVGVSRKTKGFLDIILERLGWVVDPPEETEGYFEEDTKGGFGVIRLTINDDDNG